MGQKPHCHMLGLWIFSVEEWTGQVMTGFGWPDSLYLPPFGIVSRHHEFELQWCHSYPQPVAQQSKSGLYPQEGEDGILLPLSIILTLAILGHLWAHVHGGGLIMPFHLLYWAQLNRFMFKMTLNCFTWFL